MTCLIVVIGAAVAYLFLPLAVGALFDLAQSATEEWLRLIDYIRGDR